MFRSHRSTLGPLTAGIAASLLAGCTQTPSEQATAPRPTSIASPSSEAPNAAPADAAGESIVVTGSRVTRQDYASASPTVRSGKQGSPMVPPPPPPPPLPAGSRAVALAMAPNAIMPAPMPPRDHVAQPGYRDVGRDKFDSVAENPFRIVKQEPVSTFSIDVDTASYAFVRASLGRNVLPQPAAVRSEELINYFSYDYAPPANAQQPFTTHVAVFPSPWTPGRQLVRIGIKGYELQKANRPRANLVFLIDTSGSMNAPNKLPLVQQSLGLLLDQLDGDDLVSIVTYAGSAGTALAPTPAREKLKIRAVIDGLGARGGTAGGEGIRQAYALAEKNFDKEGVNRVLLATDGDFNIGITDQNELKGFIERERGKGVYLSVLGFGMGNYNDALMQTLAQNGNGAAAYIDTLNEARKTLVEEAGSTLFPIARDVKIQVEFNPAQVAEYRLIGYENRMLAREDFDNDQVDAGEVGSGQSVTALYEIVPVGGPRAYGDLRYGETSPAAPRGKPGELGYVKIRYKLPRSDSSTLIATPILHAGAFARFDDAPADARWAASVAGFAELLRGGKYAGSLDYDKVLAMARAARGSDDYGYRAEFIQLVRAAKTASAMARLD